MPAFSESLELVYERVSDFLLGELALHIPKLTRVDTEAYPLLLLEVDDDIAGFAAIDESIRDSYTSAYNAFQSRLCRHACSDQYQFCNNRNR